MVFVSTLMTYVIEPSSGMNANSCWTPDSWKKDAVWPCAAGKDLPSAPGYAWVAGWKNETAGKRVGNLPRFLARTCKVGTHSG